MEQINNIMLNMLRELSTPRTSSKPSAKSGKPEGEPFRDLMTRYSQKVKDTAQEGESTECENPQGPVQQAPEQEPDHLREAMAAAMTLAPVMQMYPNQEIGSAESEPLLSPVAQELSSVSAQSGAVVSSEIQPDFGQARPAPVVEQASQPVEQTIRENDVAPQTADVKAAAPEVRTVLKRDLEVKVVDTEDTGDTEVKDVDARQDSLFGQVENVPVKVGEVPKTERSSQAEPVEKQVLEPLTKALERGESKVTIQLAPEHLGTVKVDLTRHADGTLRVVLTAESSRTQALLEKHAANLQTGLLTQNEATVKVEVRQQEGGHHADDYPQDGNREGHPQQQHQNRHRQDGQDFLQRLRLGLMPLDGEAVS